MSEESTQRNPESNKPKTEVIRRRTKSKKWWFIVVLLAIGMLGLFLIFPCIERVRVSEGWMGSLFHIREIGSAIQSYHDANGHLPPAVVRDKEGRPLYSWRVLILPYIEEGSLFEQFRLDEPWDSPHNSSLAKSTPRCYRLWGGNDDGQTHCQVFTGKGTAFEHPGLTFSDFPDGLGNTLFVVQASETVPWSKPVDLIYDPAAPLPNFGTGQRKPIHFLCRVVGSRPGFTACFADGSGRFIRASTDEKLIRALITRNGGEKMDASWLD
jgi:hypothetical protein